MRISGEFLLRLLTSIILLSFAAFSVFGFLASFEGGKYNVYHLVYGAGGLACRFCCFHLRRIWEFLVRLSMHSHRHYRFCYLRLDRTVPCVARDHNL
ncbi:MAG: hypothetical protein DME26_07825 [Verrucomicrobia bacterium]|nr:MAG: hypothetical protein DME26_07825 [Verrucomicrobiota bacterium]